jgi:DinB superfamily
LDCAAALRAIARGGYVKDRVFFANEEIAVSAGFRPCAVCLPESYAKWKGARGRSMSRRQKLLIRLDRAWGAFKESYAGLSDPELLDPGVTGASSVRDIIAHVTTWEEEALKHLPVVLEGKRPPRYSVIYGGIDAFNAKTTEQKKKLSLLEVFRSREDIHRQLIELVEAVLEDQLGGDTRFRRRLRLDTYGHYPQHADAIRKWRERRLFGATSPATRSRSRGTAPA